MKKEKIVCDGCGNELTGGEDELTISSFTTKFADGTIVEINYKTNFCNSSCFSKFENKKKHEQI